MRAIHVQMCKMIGGVVCVVRVSVFVRPTVPQQTQAVSARGVRHRSICTINRAVYMVTHAVDLCKHCGGGVDAD